MRKTWNKSNYTDIAADQMWKATEWVMEDLSIAAKDSKLYSDGEET